MKEGAKVYENADTASAMSCQLFSGLPAARAGPRYASDDVTSSRYVANA
eukprot:CAMPEP_0201632202 /NCGR_PEP_ID=MMETSP0493-20130528/5920_1 /ASSEMBLY_ACC=CAM_ASM_000838 /TAXON_ID=420259 /ORGANISM="Thalassiosira gravida, Strain GMp14c1" /LENGTH=48 /DNA_ID= /DNA_START= /DNA_END= /DNA_ORIENTATION=